jgi:putative ABC transport system permease protein
VLSEDLWTRRFGRDPNILGRSLTLDGRAYAVVGVLASDTAFGRLQLWTPLALDPALAGDRTRRFLRVVGRLKPGVTLEQANAALARVAARLERDHPDTHSKWTAIAEPIDERLVGDIRPALQVLTAAVAFVLLIACANVANLLLVRASGRGREAAVRVALGASRGRLVRESLAESLLVAVTGGALGVWMAGTGVNLLLSFFPRNLGNVAIPRLQAIPVDGRVLGFSLLLVFASGVLFGLAPALRASAADPADCLREGGRTTAGVARGRLRSLLVGVEMALALVLTSAAALTVHGFARLQSERLGFDPSRVLTMRVMLPQSRYDGPGQRRFMDETLARLRAVPGVEAVGTTTYLPLSGWYGEATVAVEGRPSAPPGQEAQAQYRMIQGDLFGALGTPLLRGRPFGGEDRADGPKVAIVNETFVRRHFAGGDAVGRRIDFNLDSDVPGPVWREIVGVVADVRQHGLVKEPAPEVYLPFAQEPVSLIGYAVRAAGDPGALAGPLRQAIWQVDKDQPVSYVLPLATMAAETTALQRTSTYTLLAFTGIALGLAALGLYGVLAFAVSQRSHEIGIRVAMGASRRDILAMIVGQGLRLSAAGLVVGLAASLALTRLLSSLLFGVSPYDVPTLAVVVSVLLLTAVLASLIPALRATRVDPLSALRHE